MVGICTAKVHPPQSYFFNSLFKIDFTPDFGEQGQVARHLLFMFSRPSSKRAVAMLSACKGIACGFQKDTQLHANKGGSNNTY